jgi:ABC-type multidrug transport system ATPase subunit
MMMMIMVMMMMLTMMQFMAIIITIIIHTISIYMCQVSIGVDIIHFPSIIFLDEPTSGLDSHTALSVVETLKSVAAILNCTVILTIHQPSSRIFSSMDKVVLDYDTPNTDYMPLP